MVVLANRGILWINHGNRHLAMMHDVCMYQVLFTRVLTGIYLISINEKHANNSTFL